ncbi:MAG TPA: LLM class F420-dependent oxidoreductase [Acidimicrobiales bacterium]
MTPRDGGATELRFGVDLSRCNPARWHELARAADELGFESLWLPEHLIMPATITGSPAPGRVHGRIDPTMPVFDAFAMLASLATVTRRVRVGTNVFNIGLRHPFVTARGAVTVDIVSGGRFDLGVGASWLAEEWRAVGLDFATRGARVDEAVRICQRLWSEPVVAHHGEHFHFDDVVFEPKPLQQPLPIHVGGDSRRALRRAVELGDGWIGMVHEPDSFATAVATLRTLCDRAGRDLATLQRTAIVAHPTDDDIVRWTEAGATRLIVAPWRRSATAIDDLSDFARRQQLPARAKDTSDDDRRDPVAGGPRDA